MDNFIGEMPTADQVLARRAYYANILFIDEWIGSVLDALESSGLYKDTFILFVSDHGDGQSDHWHWRKSYPYEFSSHIPMMLSWHSSFNSSIPRNSVLNDIVELRDIFPTFLSLAGATPAIPLNGTSLTC